MVEPKYVFEADPARGLLRITLSGHWSVEDLARYRQAQRVEIDRLGRIIGDARELRILFDSRGQNAYSQNVLLEMSVAGEAPIHGSPRAAVLVSNSLLGMQARRVRKDLKVFDSEEEALSWLFSE